MMLRKFLAAALTFTVFSAPAYASVVYDFTINNPSAAGGGTVEGTVTLPSSANGTYAASSVVVTSNTAGFGLGQYVGSPGNNSFALFGGDITPDALTFFEDFGADNSSPAVTCCSLVFSGFSAGLTDSATEVNDAGTVTFTLAPAATPLPAALPLFATGLGALGLLGWRRKRKAQAVTA